MRFEHEFDDGFCPPDAGESLFGLDQCLVEVRHGVGQFLGYPPTYEVVPSDYILLGWRYLGI